jgi:PAS domain S-box-containing protein
MLVPDIRTIMLVLVFPSIVCFVILMDQWLKYKDRYKGLGLLFIDFLMQSMVVPLMMLRGVAPDWLSMIVSNSLSIAGLVIGYHGICRFMDRKCRIWPGVVGVLLFVAIQTWFTYGYPDFGGRSINVAFASMCIFFGSAIVLHEGLTREFRKSTMGVKHVFLTFGLLEAVRVLKYIIVPLTPEDLFKPNMFESWVMIAYLILVIMIILSFMSMISSRLMIDVKAEEEKFFRIFHSAPYAMVITRLQDGMILYVNEGFCRITGYLSEEVIGRLVPETFAWVNVANRDEVLAQLQRTGSVPLREYMFRMKTGDQIHGLYAAELVSIGNISCVVSSFNDITCQVKAQEEIKLMNEDLERRVLERTHELEAFTYSVSHDLRAPLRAIDGFSRIIQAEYGDRLDGEGIRLFNVIVQNVHKMGRLIDELLGFSRLGKIQLNQAWVNMDQLVSAVLEDIKTIKPKEKIHFHVSKIEGCYGDWQLMYQVWINLVSNAIKFSSSRELTEIVISSQKNKTHVIYSIRDNGAGFDMKYYSKLFGVFQRLHNESEFEGNGVGLAIVQRIIRLHKGEIWAESKVGEGAVFRFSVPVKPA